MKEIVVKSLDELDALVAEHVMAQKRSELLCCRCGGSEGEHHVCGQEHIFEPEYERYSQDIAAAWPVVEKMKETGSVRLESDTRLGDWDCTHFSSAKTIKWGKTAPLAICLCALASVGITVKMEIEL